ncbi:Linear gramicidin synthase subunit D [Daldinia childiae]|uniref:Linear gramicidin synthase subunit D n=1 Tax=Daldinia childiae TaxID=326645 RepID=UPI0014464A3E|nr:Linear gramicidin synthase subunit D [Daldinia childiae]KAF3068911.1 Linear gramicidin synthase subunit D [Daldinia childiae]
MAHQEDPKLLPDVIDEIAGTEPESLYGKYPADPSNYDAGFKDVTYRQLANAINGVAQWLESEIGRGDPERTPTIAYIGPNDFRYVFAFVGAIKAGYKIFLTSPRNTVAAHLSLLENLKCSEIIVSGPVPSSVDEILQKREMRLLKMGEIEHLLNHTYEPYLYQTTLEKAKRDGSFVCHTSGTTGIPKPCIYTHEFILRTARTLSLSPPNGYTLLQSHLGHNTHILLLPLFHPAGVQLAIINAIYNRCVVILPSWLGPPSVESLLAISRNVEADWVMTAPFTLEALAKDETMLDQVASRLKMIVFAGGALPKMLGDIIAKKIRLVTFLGSSETAGLPIIYPEDFDTANDWEYMAFHPKINAVLEPRTEDSFELVLEKSVSTLPYQPVFDRFPELEKFNTGDLFKKHPTRPDMWAHASRADDIIVFLNGEKTNPVSFENHLSKHLDIEGAVVFGNQRFEAGVLIELKDKSTLSSEDIEDWVKKLWPTIEQANQEAPTHARIATSHILFSTPEKPFLRTPKGTVMRKATLDRYAEEINKLYKEVESTGVESSTNAENQVDLDDLEALLTAVRTACEESTTLQKIGVNDDLLARGIDSLQILRLCRNLRSKTNVEDLKPITIYSNPTPIRLAKAIQKAAKGHEQSSNEQDTRRSSLEETLTLFTRRIDELAEIQSQTAGREQGKATSNVCIVTGTTGSIGAYILRALMENEHIGTIYCLNRGPDSAARQRSNNGQVDPQLPTTFPKTVHFIEADLSHDTFNLDPELFKALSSSVTLIIHNAWAVDFNLPLPAFAKHLAGVENLCKFSFQSSHRPAIMFLSSISAVMDLALSSGKPVPEEIFNDLSVPAAAGYGESKYVAERVLYHAAEKLHIPVMVARIGQVCGATRSPGRWNPKEWIPRLISGSMHLGAIPDSLGAYGTDTEDVDWIPVDILADVIIEILLKGATSNRDQPSRPQVYHLMNPKLTSWSNLLPAILEVSKDLTLGVDQRENVSKAPLAVVSREEWLRRLRESANNLEALQAGQDPDGVNPALGLLDFYEEQLAGKEFPQFEMANAVSASVVLQQSVSIGRQDMEKWVRRWHR